MKAVKSIIVKMVSAVILMVMLFTSIDFLSIKAEASNAEAMQKFSPVFDAEYYAARYPELKAKYGSDADKLFDHFFNYGMSEGRQGSANFNVLVYMNSNPDLKAVFGNNLVAYYVHYCVYGKVEGRVATSSETLTYYDYVQTYFADTVFVGDSIMLGYRNYCGRQTGSYLSSVKFLCAGSYSVNNALKPVGPNALHPTYKGEKVSVWDGISKMGAKHVYIMFGTNDLAITGVDGTVRNYKVLIDNIKRQNPDADINIISMTYTVATYNGRALNNRNIDLFNEELKKMCDENGYTYVDLVSQVDDGTGNLNPAYCSDGFVHLNMSCYSMAWKPTFEKAAIESIMR